MVTMRDPRNSEPNSQSMNAVCNQRAAIHAEYGQVRSALSTSYRKGEARPGEDSVHVLPAAKYWKASCR
jgi:hypothetical protein